MKTQPILKITRKYSCAEIDLMRRALKSAVSAYEKDNSEEELRTYMMAGVSPLELEKLCQARSNEVLERDLARQRSIVSIVTAA